MMGPEVDMSGNFDSPMDVSPASMKENVSTVKVPEEKLVVCASKCEDHGFADADADAKTPEETPMMMCASNYEDNAVHMEVPAVDCDQVMASKGYDEDVEVDIVGDVVSEEKVAERESLDATESSSSFGHTDSEAGTAGPSDDVDVEVESQMRDNNASLMDFDGFNGFFRTRKKKLTTHWRKFIRPLMWRCKWAELRIRELQSQASKYEHELAECSRRKQCELEKFASEDLAVKSTPFVFRNGPVRIMKRKKRKRVEETTDLAAYSSCHSLFSYFASKRRSGDSAYLDDDHCNTEKTASGIGEFGVSGEWSFLDIKDSDSFENILRKIEVAQIHVRQLRLRIDKVVRENAENSSFAHAEPLENCGPSSNLLHVNGENFPLGSVSTISQQTSGKKMITPESVISGHREANPSNMIGMTDQLQVGRKCGKIENKILVCNQPVKEEYYYSEAVGTQPTAEPQSGNEGEPEIVQHVPDPNSPSKLMVTREQLAVKVRPKLTTPKNKRKRGRRKARAGRWSRKSSG